MILGSDRYYRLGEIVQQIIDSSGTLCHQPCLIVRESNREEWLHCVLKPDENPEDRFPFKYYYEVHTD